MIIQKKYGLDKIAEIDGRTNKRCDLLNLKIFSQNSRTFLIYKFKTFSNNKSVKLKQYLFKIISRQTRNNMYARLKQPWNVQNIDLDFNFNWLSINIFLKSEPQTKGSYPNRGRGKSTTCI